MKSFKKLAGLALILASTGALARGGAGGPGNYDLDLRYTTCRAEAMDNSGLFFLGTGRNYADAYTRALETCSRSGRRCRITCGQLGASF